MSLANRRSKQPEQFRAHLLKVAVELVVNEGYESLTLDKVARRAGVSKGGLQYHFSSKAALLQGVYDSLCAIFEPMFNEALAREPEGPKRYTRAYIRACFTEIDPLYTKAMFILTLALPEFAQKQGVWMQNLIDQDADQDTDSQSLLLCRFAADGLWIAETSGVLRFDEATRTRSNPNGAAESPADHHRLTLNIVPGVLRNGAAQGHSFLPYPLPIER